MEQADVDHVAVEPSVYPRTQIGISIADPLNRCLIEGVAAQLELTPTFLDAGALVRPELLKGIELLVVDHDLAIPYRKVIGHILEVGNGVQPALVAVIASSSLDEPLLPPKDTEPRCDGLLLLPQRPAIILAQLSVILQSHRAHTRRFQSAMHKLHFNRSIFRSIRSGVLISKAIFPHFPIAYVNPAFEEMTGYMFEEVRGKDCRFLQRNDRDQSALPLIREALRANREIVAVLRNYRKDGTAFWNELFLSPIRDLSGEVTHFVGIQNDISARVAFEEALRESEKLAAAGRLAASIAHEINNPLEAVTNMVYLARGKCNNDESERYLEMAAKELQRVSLLTAQSLRFYKQSTRPQAVRPTDLISSVLDVYNAKLLNNDIAVERRDGICEPIVCLESEIRQVLSNLVQNAIDAMRGPNRRLVIRAREATEWRSGTKGVKIAIADTGTGMTAETIKKIYTAFYTTKEVGGMGLGLWVSSGIVERHQRNYAFGAGRARKAVERFSLCPYPIESWSLRTPQLRRSKYLRDLRDRSFKNQRYRASCLNLIVAAIILWSTVYLERAITALREHGTVIEDEALAHLSPIGWEHVNLTGDYTWQAAGRLRKGKFRPLRPFVALNE